MDMEITYYLSGPMAGYEDHNYAAFEKATSILRDTGLIIKSPHEIKRAEIAKGSLPWEDYLKVDIRALLDCDAIILLAGWPSSKGARLELEIALDLMMDVYFYHEYSLTRMSAL